MNRLKLTAATAILLLSASFITPQAATAYLGSKPGTPGYLKKFKKHKSEEKSAQSLDSFLAYTKTQSAKVEKKIEALNLVQESKKDQAIKELAAEFKNLQITILQNALKEEPKKVKQANKRKYRHK